MRLSFNNIKFENEIRRVTGIYDRPVTDLDVLHIRELDCSNFDLSQEDLEVFKAFRDLEDLTLDTNAEEFDVLNLTNLKNLDIVAFPHSGVLDLGQFKRLKNLEGLYISGGSYSDMDLINPGGLTYLKNLKVLAFHEFGSVNLLFLMDMTRLETFFCGWANKIENVEMIGNLSNLKELSILGEKVDTLDFLDKLPEDVSLEICGVDILDPAYDISKLYRFRECDICEVDICGKRVIL